MNAQQLTASVELGLQDAAGVNARFTADIQLLTFADRATSARELEQAVAELLPRDRMGSPIKRFPLAQRTALGTELDEHSHPRMEQPATFPRNESFALAGGGVRHFRTE